MDYSKMVFSDRTDKALNILPHICLRKKLYYYITEEEDL